MMNYDPETQPSAERAPQKWRNIKAGLSTSTACWKLRNPDEIVAERVVLNTIAVVEKQVLHSITHLFDDDVSSASFLSFRHKLIFL